MNRLEIDVFDPSSIQFAIETLRDMKSSIDDRATDVIAEFATLGAQEAQTSFDSVPYDDGDSGVSVNSVYGKRKSHIIARGSQVAFREFGTGAKYGYGHPMPYLEDGTSMDIGSWSMSEQGKGHWNDPKGWHYKNALGKHIHSYGNRPAKGMYNAMIYILTNSEWIIRKIFK